MEVGWVLLTFCWCFLLFLRPWWRGLLFLFWRVWFLRRWGLIYYLLRFVRYRWWVLFLFLSCLWTGRFLIFYCFGWRSSGIGSPWVRCRCVLDCWRIVLYSWLVIVWWHRSSGFVGRRAVWRWCVHVFFKCSYLGGFEVTLAVLRGCSFDFIEGSLFFKIEFSLYFW